MFRLEGCTLMRLTLHELVSSLLIVVAIPYDCFLNQQVANILLQ